MIIWNDDDSKNNNNISSSSSNSHPDTVQLIRGLAVQKTCISYTNNNNLTDCIPIIHSEKKK